MKVLHITNNFPSEINPIFGIFVKEQIQSLNKIDDSNDVFFINGRENGKIQLPKLTETFQIKVRSRIIFFL